MTRLATSGYMLTFWAKTTRSASAEVMAEVVFLDVDEGYQWIGGAEVGLTSVRASATPAPAPTSPPSKRCPRAAPRDTTASRSRCIVRARSPLARRPAEAGRAPLLCARLARLRICAHAPNTHQPRAAHWRRMCSAMGCSQEWQHFAMEPVYTTPAQRGHEIQIAFLIGLKVAEFAFDDIELYELDVLSPPPPSPPPPPSVLLWRDAEGGPNGVQTVTGSGITKGKLSSDLSSKDAAQSGKSQCGSHPHTQRTASPPAPPALRTSRVWVCGRPRAAPVWCARLPAATEAAG
jgi:hypothetical protein